ncbi:MAG: VWA domain-containing protein [Bryobacteraceae bacterium]
MKNKSWGEGRGVVQVIALPVIVLIALGGGTETQVPPPLDAQDLESYRISVDVSLVVLHATVSDRQGGFASNLREQDFKVQEDGLPQQIRLFKYEDTPVTVGLVVDHSGSMRPKLDEVIAAARTFAQSSNPKDQMFVVNFNEHVTLGLPDSVQFTDSSAELERAIGRTLATGKTALYDAIARALERVRAGSRDKRVLIIISDGDDTASVHSRAQIVNLVKQSSATIYTVGLFDHDDPDANPGVLNQLAKVTGGEAFFPERLSEVEAICARIAHDIRHQYTIGYIPKNPTRDGGYRAIRVVARAADHGKLVVRTRTGYTPTGESRTPVKDEGNK